MGADVARAQFEDFPQLNDGVVRPAHEAKSDALQSCELVGFSGSRFIA